jgi:hypothetical protein
MTVKDIEKAVSQLPHSEVRKFAAWFEEFQAQLWDEEIERDAKAGRFDSLIDQAKAEHEAGHSQPL